MLDILIPILIFLVVLAVPVAGLVVGIVALVRVNRSARRLGRQISELEETVRRLRREPVPVERAPSEQDEPVVEAELVHAVSQPEPVESGSPFDMPAAKPGVAREPIQWELIVGRKALGWAAVALLIFAAAFFLRYAYQNAWVGPLGRVAIGCVAGCALMIAGWRHRRRGWRIFSQMLSAAGVVVLYLATYSAFGFYRLLPQDIAGLFLAVIMVQSAILAVRYDSLAVGLTAVLGGLLTPLLMHSTRDRYIELFIYLAALDAGIVLLMLARTWYAVGTLGLLGTQGLFWFWYDGNYHPEKLAWALGFQAVVFVLFLAHTVGVHVLRRRKANWEDLARLTLNAGFAFLAVYVLLRPDYGDWMGTMAIGMAAMYALLARLMMACRSNDMRQLVTALGVSVGFVALAFPIQADAAWIALGWAAEAAVLWWFGQRIAAPALRAIAAGLAVVSVVRLLAVDIPDFPRQPFVPIFNEYALPALGVVFCLLAGLVASRPLLKRAEPAERILAGLAGLATLVLLWFILSVECYAYFDALARVSGPGQAHWRWMGQMSLSVLWTVIATAILAIGFWVRQAGLRWLAIGLYAVTVGKVFLVDIDRLDEIYRIAAFFVAAIFLGAAAWAYQRIKLELVADQTAQGAEHE